MIVNAAMVALRDFVAYSLDVPFARSFEFNSIDVVASMYLESWESSQSAPRELREATSQVDHFSKLITKVDAVFSTKKVETDRTRQTVEVEKESTHNHDSHGRTHHEPSLGHVLVLL